VSILVGIIPLVLLVLIIASVIGVKKGREESLERGNEMIKTVYIYLILFATLMMTIGGTVAAFMAVADIVSPPPYYQSFEDYKLQPQYKGEIAPSTPVTPAQTLSDAELKSRYDQRIIDEKANTKQRAVNSLIKSFGWIIVPLPIFLYFQNRIKKTG
jgi:hypothetical protein